MLCLIFDKCNFRGFKLHIFLEASMAFTFWIRFHLRIILDSALKSG